MKKSEILACLKANKKIDGFELNITNKDSRELFYVLKHLEINRAVKTQTIAIEVYAIDSKGTGSSLVTVTAADDKKSLAKKIDSAYAKAKSAKNNYYPLAKKTKNVVEKDSKKLDLNDIASNVAKAVFKADVYKDGWINSTEIFVSTITNEFVNSNGISHSASSFKIEVECVPTWSNKKEEFELYKFYETSAINYKTITEEVSEILNLAKDRSNALKIKDVDIPSDVKVLVKNDMRDRLVENMCAEMTYRYKFTKMNHYNLKDTISNTPFDLTAKAEIKGCVDSRKFDKHGVVLGSKKIISKGIANDNFGDIQFGHYLGIKKITGNLPTFELTAKGVDYNKKKHLIIETFSSPQLEENSGYWGGEVRLARYFDGKKYIPLTGFSISGNIYEDMKSMEFSKEQAISSGYKGPKYFIFKGISIH